MPAAKVTKDKIIETACNIVRLDGFESLNARRLAFELGGSVQLIYHNFATMDELNAAVREAIQWFYEGAMNAVVDVEHPYLAKGLSYVRFARDYPEYFKVILQSIQNVSLDELLKCDLVTLKTMRTIDRVFTLVDDEVGEFHKRVWIFTHGIACLLSAQTLEMSDDEIRELLVSTTWAIYRGMRKEEQCKQ